MVRDTGLAREMALVLAAVLALDLLFAGVIALLLTPWTAPLGDALADALGIGSVPRLARLGALLALGVALLLPAQLRVTRRALLERVDARPATRESRPALAERVRRLAKLADARPPAVAVVDSDVPNCFSVAGVGAGTIVVSEGLLDALDGDGLDAVLAHELAHLVNRDAAVLTLASFLPTLVDDRPAGVLDGVSRPLTWAVATVLGYVLAAGAIDAPPFSLAYTGSFVALVVVVVLLGGAVLGALAVPMTALSARLAVSREFAADRAAALLTGDPTALASALETLDGDAASRPAADARETGVARLCLLPGGFEDRRPVGDGEPGDRGDGTDRFLVRTTAHPPTDERVARLRNLAADLETGATHAG